MTLREKLTQRIAQEQAEIDRITVDAVTNTTAAKQRLALLRGAQAALTPELEQLIVALNGIGVKILE